MPPCACVCVVSYRVAALVLGEAFIAIYLRYDSAGIAGKLGIYRKDYRNKHTKGKLSVQGCGPGALTGTEVPFRTLHNEVQ